MRASNDGAATARRAAAVAYWAAAVLFVTGVAVVYGWLPGPVAAGSTGDGVADGLSTPEPSDTGDVELTLSGGAQVTFPAPPEESTQVLLIAGSDTLLRLHSAVGPEGATYNMGEISYPAQVNLSDPAANLIASVSGAAGNVNGRVVEQDVIEFQGVPAVVFVIEAEDVRLRARHVLDGRRLYAQNVAYRGEEEPGGTDAFFDSFQLPDDAAASPSPTPEATFEPTLTPLPGD